MVVSALMSGSGDDRVITRGHAPAMLKLMVVAFGLVLAVLIAVRSVALRLSSPLEVTVCATRSLMFDSKAPRSTRLPITRVPPSRSWLA